MVYLAELAALAYLALGDALPAPVLVELQSKGLVLPQDVRVTGVGPHL